MWYVFFGRHELGMTRAEIWCTSLWEMQDMVSALAVYNGNAKQKHRRSLSEVLAMR